MSTEPEIPLPKPPDDPDRLRRLQGEALLRVQREEREAAPVYGGPPVGGGRPVGASGSRGEAGPGTKPRWTRRGLLITLGAILAALVAAVAGWRFLFEPVHRPLYGGPPMDNRPLPPRHLEQVPPPER